MALKTFNMFGCFEGDTRCLINQPGSIGDYSSDWSDDSLGLRSVHGTATVIPNHATESAVKIKDVPLGARVQTQNPNRYETQYDPANESFTRWKRISLEVRHANGSVVDAEILRSPQWIEQHHIQVGKMFSFDLTEINVDGRGLVRSINDAPDVLPGEGAVVTGRYATRAVNNRVRVTLADGTSITGTANHPVWCVERDQWSGLGELEPGHNLQARHGAVEVATVEFLDDAAPVYNLEVAGEHVYEITELGILVHNADWDCGKFLKLQTKVRKHGKDSLSSAQLGRYDELLNMVKNNFIGQLKASEIDTLVSAAPEALVEAGGHLHHILPKLGREVHRDQILKIQRKLWFDHGIDPFMSLDIFVFALTKGVHTNQAIEHVLKELDVLLKSTKNTNKVLDRLKELGGQAQDGFKNLLGAS
ncbi:MAG: hypothetical protein KF752_14550 [Pirellulaceae bacterium]|nr:hypothetical protein [Pirellulaceae bacterium]